MGRYRKVFSYFIQLVIQSEGKIAALAVSMESQALS